MKKQKALPFYLRPEHIQDKAKEALDDLRRLGFLAREPEMDYEEAWGIIADALAEASANVPPTHGRRGGGGRG